MAVGHTQRANRRIGRARLTAALLASTALLAAGAAWQPARAADATWPGNTDCNDADGTNWTGGTVPDGTATFDATAATGGDVSDHHAPVGGSSTFTAGAPAYTFTSRNSLFIQRRRHRRQWRQRDI